MQTAILRLAIALAFSASFTCAAHALVFKTWVSNSGSDSGLCARAAPCATFNYAITQTFSGGEVTCLSSGDFGPINPGGAGALTTSIVINCLGHVATTSDYQEGEVVVINTSASDRVVLRGLDLSVTNSAYAIDFKGAGTLILDQVKVTGRPVFAAPSTLIGSGLLFEPSGIGKLVISNSIFTNAGTSSGAGIRVVPIYGGTAQVSISTSNVSGNAFGIAFDGSNSTGGINATITDSVMASNINDGVVATSASYSAPVGVTVVNAKSLNNGFGIRSIGSNVTVRVKDSTIIGNGTGLSGGGALITGGGNTVQANATNGSFTGSYPQQ